jgi:chaperonin cofactor prefoldin
LKLAEIVAQRLRTTDKELSKIRSQLDRLQEQLERKSHGTSEGSTAEAAAAS